MNIKKLKRDNPDSEFIDPSPKRVDESILKNSVQSKLNVDSYQLKYSDQVSIKSDSSAKTNAIKDNGWKMLLKKSKSEEMDTPIEPKITFYDENGEEQASQG